ncbi:MAG: DEAD/DEAH box helicase [Bacteroidia bacterium]
MTFEDLKLIAPLTQALTKKGYTIPTPIQEQAIPAVLKGHDLFGCAQTGTGKTAAFALPIIQHLVEKGKLQSGVRALILAPTRELALQISENFTEYAGTTGIRNTVIFGGVSQTKQVNALRRGVDVVIATPGRLLDLMNQGYLRLDSITHFVLDEADRMLDMGFIHDIKKIITKLPRVRQTLFFSATVPQEIKALAASLLQNPIHVKVEPVESKAVIEQSLYYVDKENKRALLRHVITTQGIEHALVFTRTKRGADRVVKDLNQAGIKAEAIHGDKSQNARERALKGFKSRTVHVLVATDIASRGIDVEKLSHVINFELPEQSETYVHRIGRTGRAGESGIAISFCTGDEKPYLDGIRKLTGQTMNLVTAHPFENLNMRSSDKPAASSNQRTFSSQRNTFRKRKQY